MKIDLYPGFGLRISDAAQTARDAQAQGYDGLWALEAAREPFSPLAIAAMAAPGLELRTGIAVAFARNPMVTAQLAHELAIASEGRFVLGIGSQVRPHIERRFSETWSRPAARMGEYVDALRAIWTSWNDRVPLNFQGEFYRHTLMIPMFDPGPSGLPMPPVHVAAVGPAMVEMAATKADGLVLHPLSSVRTVTERVLPSIAERRGQGKFELTCPVLVATGDTDEQVDKERAAVRKQLAFYASTPAYHWVLEMYGEGDRAQRLHAWSREGRWDEMTGLITDELLDEFSVVAGAGELHQALRDRWDGVLDHAGVYRPITE